MPGQGQGLLFSYAKKSVALRRRPRRRIAQGRARTTVSVQKMRRRGVGGGGQTGATPPHVKRALLRLLSGPPPLPTILRSSPPSPRGPPAWRRPPACTLPRPAPTRASAPPPSRFAARATPASFGALLARPCGRWCDPAGWSWPSPAPLLHLLLRSATATCRERKRKVGRLGFVRVVVGYVMCAVDAKLSNQETQVHTLVSSCLSSFSLPLKRVSFADPSRSPDYEAIYASLPATTGVLFLKKIHTHTHPHTHIR